MNSPWQEFLEELTKPTKAGLKVERIANQLKEEENVKQKTNN